MNIAIFTNNYLPNPYGVTGSIESFRKQFKKNGHTVYVFAPENSKYIDNNSNIFRYPSIDIKYKIKFPLPIPYNPKIETIIKNLDLDIIHSQHPNLLGDVAMRWARRKKIPLVFTWHTLYDQYTNYIPLIPEKIVGSLAIKNAVNYANKCDKVIAPTESAGKIIKKWGVKGEKIIDIPTGIENNFLEKADKKFLRNQYNIADDEKVLLLVSRLTDEKNVGFLLQIVVEILKNNKKVRLVVVGEGYLKKEIQRFVREKNVNNKVVFAGEQPRERVKNYYAGSDIFVYASKSETQGTVITEAMAMGLPIVAVRATGIKDQVVNSSNGFLVKEEKNEFCSAIQNLLDDDNLRIQFAKKSREIIFQKYTSEICANKMLAVYKKLKNNY